MTKIASRGVLPLVFLAVLAYWYVVHFVQSLGVTSANPTKPRFQVPHWLPATWDRDDHWIFDDEGLLRHNGSYAVSETFSCRAIVFSPKQKC